MKKLLSYFWPFTRKVPSPINGTLEITWINGKKVLDSLNTNYSYGALQKVLEHGLRQISFDEISEVLLLGLGGACVIQSLRGKFGFTGKMTAVELDEVVIALASEEFGVRNTADLTIINADAEAWVRECSTNFDLIIIDLFIDSEVPCQFYELEFWRSLLRRTTPGGYIIFNAGINLTHKRAVDAIISELQSAMRFTVHEGINETNTLLIGQKR